MKKLIQETMIKKKVIFFPVQEEGHWSIRKIYNIIDATIISRFMNIEVICSIETFVQCLLYLMVEKILKSFDKNS